MTELDNAVKGLQRIVDDLLGSIRLDAPVNVDAVSVRVNAYLAHIEREAADLQRDLDKATEEANTLGMRLEEVEEALEDSVGADTLRDVAEAVHEHHRRSEGLPFAFCRRPECSKAQEAFLAEGMTP